MMFSPGPDPLAPAGPPVCTRHPTFVTRPAAGLQGVLVRGGESVPAESVPAAACQDRAD